MKATCARRADVGRHFEGRLSPRAEHAMREHLAGCDACRGLYRRRLLLSRLDPAALPADERLARGLGIQLAPRGRPGAIARVLTGVAIAATLLVVVSAHRARPSLSYAARGGGDDAGRASRVVVYDVDDGASARPVAGPLKADHELAFAYENGAGKPWLAIFGVDEHDHVYWFHPAWTSPAENPLAIAVARDDQRHELSEAIRHHFDGARLEIRSLFLERPLSVREIEDLLRRTPRGPLPIPGAVEHSVTLRIVP